MAVESVAYRSERGRGQWLFWLLGIWAVLMALTAIHFYRQTLLIQELQAGIFVPEDRLVLSDVATGAVFFFRGLLYLITGIVFLIWMYRSLSNLPALGVTPLRIRPGWAVVSFFIPVVNLYHPYQAMVELWDGSCAAQGTSTRLRPVGLWWGLWLLSSTAWVGGLQPLSDPEFEVIPGIAWFGCIGSLITMVTALLLIWVIRGVQVRQDRAATQHSQPIYTPAPAPSAPTIVPF